MGFLLHVRSIVACRLIPSQQLFRRLSVDIKPSIDSESSPSSSLTYDDSILVLSLLLPSRQETCRFHLNLQTANIGQLMNEIKLEDAGVEQVHIYDETGHLLAQSYLVKSLMNAPFTIQLNQQRTFLFDPQKNLRIKDSAFRRNQNEGQAMEDTVAALYRALNLTSVYNQRYQRLKIEAEQLTAQLEPLEKIKEKIANISKRYTSRCIWYGLAGMSFQVGILAELTWDVYSWDIVEPISYFIAFGTAMIFYAFHVMTRMDFEYITMSDRLFLRQFYRESKRQSFDVAHYNRLKDRLFNVHTDLARLRAPLSLSLPILPNSLKCKISGEDLSTLDVYRNKTKY